MVRGYWSALGVVAAVAIACGTESAPPDEEVPAEVVFYGDVEVTLGSYCVRCHQDGGGAPFDFEDYDSAAALSEAMVAAVDAGRMPPPASDPGCRDYADSDLLVLPEEEKQRLRDWVAGGAQPGNPDDHVPRSDTQFDLPEANLTIQVETPYTPTYADSSSLGNEYRCFTIDHDRTSPFFITAIHALIDKQQISHHMVLGKLPRDSADAERGRQPGGFDCATDATLAIDDGFIHAWAPGQSPLRFNEGVGLEVRPDESFILQMHYYQGSESNIGLSDQPGYAMVTADSVTTPAIVEAYGPTGFTIPAGEAAHTLTDVQPSAQAGQIHAIFPHMHVLGTEYEASIEGTCIAAGDYDFDNQMFYYFNEPIQVQAGDEFSMSCTWNNSTSNGELIHNPPVDVTYGERTDQEMCYAFMMVSR